MLIKTGKNPISVTNTVRYCIEEVNLESAYIQRLGALLVVDEDTYKLQAVYPLLGNTVFVGKYPTLFEALENTDNVDRFVGDADKGMIGTYVWVDDDNIVQDVLPPPKRVVFTVSWMPGFMPRNMDNEVLETFYGQDLDDFTPLMDMLEEFSDMAKETGIGDSYEYKPG